MSRKRKRKHKRKTTETPSPKSAPPESSPPKSDGPLRTWVPPLVAVVLVLTAGVLYGVQTHRWTVSADVQEAAERLNGVPLTVGEWDGRDLPMDQGTLEQAGAVGHLHRSYRNHVSGEVVNVMVLCGPHGPISLHPPTVCFTGAGWAMKNFKTDDVGNDHNDSLGRFHIATFQKTLDALPVRMHTYWAWNATGQWEVPERPRFAFAGHSCLFKLYVTRVLPEKPEQLSLPVRTDQPKTSQDDPPEPEVAFMSEFIPAFHAAVFEDTRPPSERPRDAVIQTETDGDSSATAAPARRP